MAHHAGQALCRARGCAPARMVSRARNAHEPVAGLRAGGVGTFARPELRHHRHAAPGGSNARSAAPGSGAGYDARRICWRARVVHGVPAVDARLDQRTGRRSGQKQPRHVLDGAGGGVCGLYRKRECYVAVSRTIPQPSFARSNGGGRELSTGAQTQQALQLLALQSRHAGHDLRDCVCIWQFDNRGDEQFVAIRAPQRRPLQEGRRLHVSVYRRQEQVALPARY